MPRARINEVGDVVLEDVRQLRALADPGRLAVFDALQKRGPQSIGALAGALGTGEETVRDQIEVLAAAGLVEQVASGVQALGRGLFLPPPSTDPEMQQATRALGVVMLRAVAQVPQRWLDEIEPGLDADWAAAAGLFNAGVVLTRDEVELVQAELERVLEPYLNRPEADRPVDAAKVRVLAWFLPEAPNRRSNW